jgi:hypothetical protein
VVAIAVLVGVGAVSFWGRRYRRPNGAYRPPRWFDAAERLIFLAWAALSLIAGLRHPSSAWGIFELVVAALIVALSIAPTARGRL